MPIEFVLCRLKSDHSVTHEIARQSLRRWPDWEPVPGSEVQEQATSGESPADTATGPEPTEEPGASDAKDPKTPKSRSRAATDK